MAIRAYMRNLKKLLCIGLFHFVILSKTGKIEIMDFFFVWKIRAFLYLILVFLCVFEGILCRACKLRVFFIIKN